MTSTFGWLDQDEDQRKRMLQIVELFKDEGTVDELGIGAIRDTISDLLFPGTSVLHTRLRYVLFVPWLLGDVARQGLPPERATKELRRLEIKLIYALLKSGETEGVIGQQARDKLKRTPSSAYWAVTGRWGVRTRDTTIEGFFRAAKARADLRQIEPDSDDPGTLPHGRPTGLHPHLPKAPDDLLRACTFQLTREEADFLAEQIVKETTGSLLAWMVREQSPPGRTLWVWQHEHVDHFPAEQAEVVEHGRRFHSAIHGAGLLYNLLLAERRGSDESVGRYRDMLDAWREELASTRPLDGWDRPTFWSMLRRHNPRLAMPTQRFVDRWLDGLDQSAEVEQDGEMRALVAERERQLKGGRARLINQAALDQWRGDSGLVRLDYRWSVAGRLLDDLHQARAEA